MSAAHAVDPHWVLVGPWYRWARPGLPADGLASAPAIQKFAGSDFIARFLERPQHSLKYDEQIDVVQEHDFVFAGKWGGKLASFLRLDAKGRPFTTADGKPRDPVTDEALYRPRPAPTGLRKLYQPTHDRHYLVTCELHCNVAGFPRVDRRKVCQSAFVLRRRRSLPGKATADEIDTAGAPVRAAQADLYELLHLQAASEDPGLPQAERDHAAARMQRLATAAWTDWATLVARRRAAVAQAQASFAAWQRDHGVGVRLEGWFPVTQGERTQRGEWRTIDAAQVDADPATSGEQTYPLFALVPDPRLAAHDAAGRTLFYGVVPTQDLQLDAAGKPHLDDASTYELRCFVRQHHACPGRAGRQPDCHGPIAWSAATQAFRVAAPFDVLGSSNRAVHIKMPDLRDLAAQAALRPRGRLSPVHFEQPQHLSPDGSMGGAAICSFSIPLITIVALFVLNIFLPIVVFIFQLWFLLAFRFCILPQVAASAGLDAKLAVTPPGVDFEADLDVKVEGLAETAAEFRALVDGTQGGGPSLADRIRGDSGLDFDDPPAGVDGDVPLDDHDNNAVASLAQNYADIVALKPQADGTIVPPETGTPLVYEDPVTALWPPRKPA